MAFTVTFYNFSKRENSTARPSVSGTDYNVVLKDVCSVISPRFELQVSAMPQFNYCYCANFAGRYYFVKEWRWEKPFWVAYCEEDVLGTWRTSIGNSTQYVLRSSHSWDMNVVDKSYPAKIGVRYAETSVALSSEWVTSPNLSRGWFVIGVINGENSSGSYGGVSYYALQYTQMRNLLAYMFDDAEAWENIEDLSGALAKPFLDPMQYITTCMWFPVHFNTAGVGAEPIRFGFWQATSDITGYPIGGGNTAMWDSTLLTIPRPSRSDSNIRGNWLYLEPFAHYKLVCFPWGAFDIPGNLVSQNGIRLRVLIDFISGIGTLLVFNNITGTTGGPYSQTIFTQDCQIGIPMALSQIYTRYRPTQAGEYMSGLLYDIVRYYGMGATSDVGSCVEQSATTVKSAGSSGGIVQASYMSGTAYLQMSYYDAADENLNDRGRPLMQIKQISTIPGFIICADGDIAIAGSSEESLRIKQYLTGGFFYE